VCDHAAYPCIAEAPLERKSLGLRSRTPSLHAPPCGMRLAGTYQWDPAIGILVSDGTAKEEFLTRRELPTGREYELQAVFRLQEERLPSHRVARPFDRRSFSEHIFMPRTGPLQQCQLDGTIYLAVNGPLAQHYVHDSDPHRICPLLH
jgi:hypothetical protein